MPDKIKYSYEQIGLSIFIALILHHGYHNGIIGLIGKPFYYLSVLVHEIGHALGALLTGGKTYSIELGSIFDNAYRTAGIGGGLAHTNGGYRSLILLAGYASTPFVGAMLFIGTKRNIVTTMRIIPAIVLILLTLVILLWVRDPLTLVLVAVVCMAFIMLTKIKDPRIADFLFTFIAIYLIIAGFTGPERSTTVAANSYSDTTMLADLHSTSPMFWVYLWWGWTTALCVACFWFTRGNIFDEEILDNRPAKENVENKEKPKIRSYVSRLKGIRRHNKDDGEW